MQIARPAIAGNRPRSIPKNAPPTLPQSFRLTTAPMRHPRRMFTMMRGTKKIIIGMALSRKGPCHESKLRQLSAGSLSFRFGLLYPHLGRVECLL